MKSPLSRRSFLLGASALTAGGIATGLLGCSSSNELADSGNPENDIAWDLETDIIVVGSGYAGMCAAIESYDQGSSVIIVEKAPAPGGNSILCGGMAQFGGGTSVQKAAGFEDTPERFYNEIFDYGECRATPELLQSFIDHSVEQVEWMKSIGVEFNEKLNNQDRMTVNSVHNPAGWPVASGNAYWIAFNEAATSRGIELQTECQATGLITNEEGAVVGITVAKDGTELNYRANQAVILACGGWKANVAMRQNYDPRLDAEITASGLPYFETTGEMINAAVDAGAGLCDMSFVCEMSILWGCDTMQYWTSDPNDAPEFMNCGVPISDCSNVVFVDANAKRFVNEDLLEESQPAFVETYLSLPERPRNVWAIADAAGAATLNWEQDSFKNPSFEGDPHLTPGMLVCCGTLSELAKAIGVDENALAATLDEYNNAIASGAEDAFGKTDERAPIAEAPFFAVKMQLFAHDQMGGLRANTKGQVIKRSAWYGPGAVSIDELDVVPHLYAAGETVGGYWGRWRGHGKIGAYMIQGRLAAMNAAQEKSSGEASA